MVFKKGCGPWNKIKRQVIKCQCGCGQELDNYDRWGGKRCFICGHQSPMKKGHKINIGSKRAETTKALMRKQKTGHLNPSYGKKEEKAFNWKGKQAGYEALHLRVKVKYGRPKRCEKCGTTNKRKIYDWANLTGKYDDPKDYSRMCRQCHAKYDKQRRRA